MFIPSYYNYFIILLNSVFILSFDKSDIPDLSSYYFTCDNDNNNNDDCFDTSDLITEGISDEISGKDVSVETRYGWLKGKQRNGTIPKSDDIYEQVNWFLGIPYATPPLGSLRFRKTEKLKSWSGERRATKFGSACPQNYSGQDQFYFPQSEDCLYLNIYSPVQDPKNESQLPVMVFIHGGSYMVGSGNHYIGDALAQNGVVVVTINYRLGVLGFLSAKNSVLKGNYGLYDQIESLKWIQENIGNFGGDPNQVTILGNSAGGASVAILSYSPASKGLFKQTIMQSGSALSYWAQHTDDQVDYEGYVKKLARNVGCHQTDFEALVECLRYVPTNNFDLFIMQYNGVLPVLKPTRHDMVPIIDGEIILSNVQESFQRGLFHVENIMAGVVSNEWSRHIDMYFDLYLFHLRSQKGVPFNQVCPYTSEQFIENLKYVTSNLLNHHELTGQLALDRYTNFSTNQSLEITRQEYLNFASDLAFIIPTINYLRLVKNYTKAPAYFYVFNYEHQFFNDYKRWQQNHHESELVYLFGIPFRTKPVKDKCNDNYTENDKNVTLWTLKIWSNFAKYGNPNVKNVTNWKPFRTQTSDYFLIDQLEKSTAKEYFRSEYVAFWNKIVPMVESKIKNIVSEKTESCHHQIILTCAILVIILTILFVLIIVAVIKNKKSYNSNNENVS